jgi:hypothetical protein
MLRWVDGFEHYGVIARMTEGVGGGAAWSEVNVNASDGFGGWELSTTNPATGAYHLRLSDGGASRKLIRRIWGIASQVVGHGYRFSVDDLPAREGGIKGEGALVLAEVRDVSNNTHFTLILGTDGSIVAKRGFDVTATGANPADANGTIIDRSDPCVARGGYHHFEFKTKIDNTTGYIEVRVNEVTVLNLTGIDTQGTANAEAAQFVIGKANTLGGGAPVAGFGTFDYDDPFAWDDDNSDAENTVVDFVGDKGAYWLAPTSDTAESDHSITGSATAYGAIDEVPPSGTDYLSDATGAARTVVGLAALPGNVAEVIAFVPLLYARKEESGTVTYRTGLVVGTDETYGPEDNPNTEYAYLRPGPKTIDPDTGVPWTSSAAPKLLIERTA